jgi:mono/diheme cytochrome c family protein
MASKKKKILIVLGVVVLAPILGGAGFVGVNVSAYGSSMSKVYDVPAPAIQRATDDAAIARGKHLAESIGGCIECHGADMGGKSMDDMGPIGQPQPPNLTTGKGGVGNDYSDEELARAIRHGIRKDGTSTLFMPSMDFYWWPDEDVAAVIGWLRSLPPVDREMPESRVGTLGKILDRQDLIPLDVARRIDHEGARPNVPEPAPTAEYGEFLGKLCMGCHGKGLSGGPIPGAPPEMAVPTNLTKHATGLEAYSEEDFINLLNTGVKPDGSKLDPFMPIATTKTMNETEKKALWAYLQTLPPTEFGNR